MRTQYQEVDRILTVLTPDHGKLRLIAKGVRRPKSKLAGGIELFSISDFTVLPSMRDLKTLVSSRLDVHFGNIAKDINRTMLGYELLKKMNRATEDHPEAAYFELLTAALEGLDDITIPLDALELWFTARLLYINGHTPNLSTDVSGAELIPNQSYIFDFDEMCFRGHSQGQFSANHIKVLRVSFSHAQPRVLVRVQGAAGYTGELLGLVRSIVQQHA